mgnify:CR=1 FL=1
MNPDGHDAGRNSGGGLPRPRDGDGSDHSGLQGRSSLLGQHALNLPSLTYQSIRRQKNEKLGKKH